MRYIPGYRCENVDVLRSVRNVRYTVAGVRERKGLLSIKQKVLRQRRSKWVPGSPGVPRNA